MPDEQVPAEQETPDAPEDGGPDQGTPAEPTEGSPQAPDTDWQERYANLQPEYTRATQENSQLRQIFDLARQGDPEALQALGIPVPEQDEDDEFDDDPNTRLDTIEQVLSQRAEEESRQAQEAEFEEQVEEHLANQLDELEKQHGELDDHDAEYLLGLADLFADEDGIPDLKAAYEYDSKRLEAKREGWVKSKRTPQVRSGASASHQPDLDDPEQRREFIARRVAEAEGNV